MKDINRGVIAAALCLVCSLIAWAQWEKKPYTEWSEKEAQKLLNDSPWSQTQVFSDTSHQPHHGVETKRGPQRTTWRPASRLRRRRFP
ncbi:MAG: hypothetical protein MOB07_12080 [Acidobacteria bacterium]|nr:hypothetical protein [Acidobacteriota bacterium]